MALGLSPLGTVPLGLGNAAAASSSTTGTISWTEADDSFSIAGTLTDAGTIAWTEVNDTASIAGALTVSGSAAWTEADDTVSIAGSLPASATIAWTEDRDTFSMSGSAAQTNVWYGGGYSVMPRRTAEDRRRQREELGILPKRVESAINAVVEQQADKAERQVIPTFDYEAARRQLQAEFDRRNIELKAIYERALEDQLHAKLLQLALAAKQRQEDDDESAVHLLLM